MLAGKIKSKKAPTPKSRGRLILCTFISFILFDIYLSLSRSRYFQHVTPLLQRIIHKPGSDGTYAQNYQDTWFLRLAHYNGWDTPETKGFFLDLGAYHGVWCSNTKLIETKLPHWNGACVDVSFFFTRLISYFPTSRYYLTLHESLLSLSLLLSSFTTSLLLHSSNLTLSKEESVKCIKTQWLV